MSNNLDAKDLEINRLRSLLVNICNWPIPETFVNLPSGPQAIIDAYKVGYINGWIQYRQTIKKFIFPGGGG